MPSPVAAKASAGELKAALGAELASAGPSDPAMMLRALCGLSLASEKKHVSKALAELQGPKPQAVAAPAPAKHGMPKVLLVVLGLALAALAVKLLLFSS
jgi:hypothetical protein